MPSAPWRVDVSQTGQRIIFRGEGQILRSRIIRGKFTKEFHHGLLALNNGIHRTRLLKPWNVLMPHAMGPMDTTGKNRKYLIFSAPTVHGIVLHVEKQIPQGLHRALREAFTNPNVRREPDEERQGQRQRVPRRKGQSLSGLRRKRRQTAEDREHQRLLKHQGKEVDANA